MSDDPLDELREDIADAEQQVAELEDQLAEAQRMLNGLKGALLRRTKKIASEAAKDE